MFEKEQGNVSIVHDSSLKITSVSMLRSVLIAKPVQMCKYCKLPTPRNFARHEESCKKKHHLIDFNQMSIVSRSARIDPYVCHMFPVSIQHGLKLLRTKTQKVAQHLFNWMTLIPSLTPLTVKIPWRSTT